MALPLKNTVSTSKVRLVKEHSDTQSAMSNRAGRQRPGSALKRGSGDKTPTIAKMPELVEPLVTNIDLSELESQLDALKLWIADKKATL